MADKNIEINASVLDGVHNAFVHNTLLELAECCLKLGVKLNNVAFNYITHSTLTDSPKEILTSVNINSSKVKDR